MRGRKPSSAMVKAARGNPGKRALPAGVPDPEVYGGAAPGWLSAPARAVWAAMAPELQRLGLLTRLDVWALAMICEHFAVWQASIERIHADGSEGPMEPVEIVARKEAALLHRMLSEFGFTPTSRIRLALKESPTESVLAKILGKKKQLDAARN